MIPKYSSLKRYSAVEPKKNLLQPIQSAVGQIMSSSVFEEPEENQALFRRTISQIQGSPLGSPGQRKISKFDFQFGLQGLVSKAVTEQQRKELEDKMGLIKDNVLEEEEDALTQQFGLEKENTTGIENAKNTRFYFQRQQKIEQTQFFFAFISIMMTIFYYDSLASPNEKVTNLKYEEEISNALLNGITTMTVLNNYELKIPQTFNEVEIPHELNDIMCIFILARIYMLFRVVLNSSVYYNTRVYRICRLYGCDGGYFYSIKALLTEKPLIVVFYMFFLSVIVFGHALRVCEQPQNYYIQDNSIDLSTYPNCFWCIIITMTTVGYGDYYPRTNPGRIIIFITSIVGVFLNSLLMVAINVVFRNG